MAVEHLRCDRCESNITVARYDGGVELICHCTHVDIDTGPADAEIVGDVPATWRWE